MYQQASTASTSSTRSSDVGLLDNNGEKRRQRTEEVSLDEAFRFIQLVNANIAYQPPDVVTLKAIGVKVDSIALPILFINVFLQWLIKYLNQSANDLRMLEDLTISQTEWANITIVASLTFLAGTFLSVLALIKIHPATWLASNTILYGIAVGCMADTQNSTTMWICQCTAAFLKAAAIPSCTLLVSQWYHKKEQPLRFCILGCGISLAQVVGPFMHYGFQQIKSSVFPGWRVMFVILGCFSILIGLITLLAHINDPTTAAGRWLTYQESATLLNYIAYNRTTVRNTTFSPDHGKAVISDPQVSLLALSLLAISLIEGVSETTTMTVFQTGGSLDLGHGTLVAVTGVIALLATLSIGFLLQYTQLNRVFPLTCVLILIMVGVALLAFIPFKTDLATQQPQISATPTYIIASLLNFTAPATILILSYAAANISGATKRAISISLISSGFALGSVITSLVHTNASKTKRPHLPLYICFSSSAIALFSILVLLGWYVFSNSRKESYREVTEQREREYGISIVRSRGDEWKNRTDQKDMDFYYLY